MIRWVRKGSTLRRIVILIVGGIVTLIGAALVVLPGPAFIVLPFGLAILATEFAWAQRLLDAARVRARTVVQRFRR